MIKGNLNNNGQIELAGEMVGQHIGIEIGGIRALVANGGPGYKLVTGLAKTHVDSECESPLIGEIGYNNINELLASIPVGSDILIFDGVSQGGSTNTHKRAEALKWLSGEL